MAPRIELFHFRFRDPLTGKWTRARYAATREEIAARYAEYEVAAPAEIRDVDSGARHFTPHSHPLDADLQRYSDQSPELKPAIDASEAFLLAIFLRRYITYCARRGRYAAMEGAARLLLGACTT
jgi:hypothetical protein